MNFEEPPAEPLKGISKAVKAPRPVPPKPRKIRGAFRSVQWHGDKEAYTTREFAKEYFPGSTDYLDDNRLTESQKETLQKAIRKAHLDSGLQKMMFVGIGISSVENRYQQGVTDTSAMRDWVEDVVGPLGEADRKWNPVDI